MSRRALTLAEVVIAALILGVSAVPVLELVRSGSSRLEVSEIEVAARQLGSDVLERLAWPELGADKGLSDAFRNMEKQQFRAEQLVEADPSLKKAFPVQGLKALLELGDVRVQFHVDHAFEHPSLGKLDDLEACVVEVTFRDRNDERKRVTFARLVER